MRHLEDAAYKRHQMRVRFMERLPGVETSLLSDAKSAHTLSSLTDAYTNGDIDTFEFIELMDGLDAWQMDY